MGCGLLLAVCTGSWVDSKPDKEGQAITSCSYVNCSRSEREHTGQAKQLGGAIHSLGMQAVGSPTAAGAVSLMQLQPSEI